MKKKESKYFVCWCQLINPPFSVLVFGQRKSSCFLLFCDCSVLNYEKQSKSPNILCVEDEQVTPTNQPSLLCSRFWSKKVQLLFAFWGDSVLNYEKQSRSPNILSLQVSNQPSLLSSPIIKRDDDDDDCDDDDDNDYCEDTIRDIGEDDDDYFEDIIGDIDNDIDEESLRRGMSPAGSSTNQFLIPN